MYFRLINSDNKRLAKLVIQQQLKYNMPNTFYTKVGQISDTIIKVNIDQAKSRGKTENKSERWNKPEVPDE